MTTLVSRGALLLLAAIIGGLASQAGAQAPVFKPGDRPKLKAFIEQPAYSRFQDWLFASQDYNWLSEGTFPLLVNSSPGLPDPEGVTIFAPNNSAIEALAPELLTCLNDTDRVDHTGRFLLENILKYNRVGVYYNSSTFPSTPTNVSIAYFTSPPFEKSTGNLSLSRDSASGVLMVNGVPLTQLDAVLVQSTDGRLAIHGIRDVLIPPEFTPSEIHRICHPLLAALEARPEFSTMVSLLTLPDLALLTPLEKLGSNQGLTLFAPNNSAFEALGDETFYCLKYKTSGQAVLKTILQYHEVAGDYWRDRVYAEKLGGDDFNRYYNETRTIVLNFTTINNLTLPLERIPDKKVGSLFKIANVSVNLEYNQQVADSLEVDGTVFAVAGLLLPPGAEKLITDAGCPAPPLVVPSTGKTDNAAAGFALPSTGLSVFVAMVALLATTFL